MAVKARVQVASFIADILTKRLPRKKAEELAVVLSEGRWTHDFPITVQAAQKLGFPVTHRHATASVRTHGFLSPGKPAPAFGYLRAHADHWSGKE